MYGRVAKTFRYPFDDPTGSPSDRARRGSVAPPKSRRHVGWLAGLAGLGLLLGLVEAWASAFNQPAGFGVAILGGLLDTGDRSFDTAGHVVKTAPYVKKEGSLYIEYGLTDWLQAVLKPDLVMTHLGGSSGGNYSGLGTSEAGAQARLLVFGPAVLAVQGSFRLPGSTHTLNPAMIGNTAREADGRALLGVLFPIGPWPSFLDVQAGYRLRGAGAPDEVHLDVTLGTRPFPTVLLLLQSFTTVPTQPAVPSFPRSTYSKLEGSVVYDLNAAWSVQVGLFATVYGRNALIERGVKAALWYRF